MTSLNLTSTNTSNKWNFWNIVKIHGANGNTMSVSGLASNSVINLGNNIDVSGNLFANNNFKIPVDTTANRPGIVGINNYYLRYNTTSMNLESYNGTAWVNLLTAPESVNSLASLTITGITYTGPFYLTSGGTSSGVPVSGGTTYYSITGDTSFVVNSGTAAQGGSGIIVPNFSGSIFYIIVGGGAAGGAGTPAVCYGGGGGGGGVAAGNTIVTSGTNYFVGVGNGGSSFISTMSGGNGGNSYAFGVTATGGIGGDGISTGFGGSNGFPQRFAGGVFSTYGTDPGQGGAGASGSVVYSTAPNYSASTGTNGYNSTIAYSITNASSGTFTSNYFAGGGGSSGTALFNQIIYGLGGLGGGGRGQLNSSSANQSLMNGVPGLGGGGGGKRGDDSFYAGMGGSGVIIVSFNTYF
uniref:Glycine-rich domain-containing protein n=1 Tax=viral metagenome TaxID=1070528 RepID=A0A6C0DTC5_9ZZZZ